MKCDVCIRKELGADVVLSCGIGNTFQNVTNCDVCTCKELYAECCVVGGMAARTTQQ